MEAHSKYIRTAPRKIRLILDAIRGLPAKRAEEQLRFMPQTAAREVYNTLHAAIANATNQGNADENLIIGTANCDEGPRLKRRVVGSRGRSSSINKQMAHIHLVLSTSKVTPTKTKTPKTLSPTKVSE